MSFLTQIDQKYAVDQMSMSTKWYINLMDVDQMSGHRFKVVGISRAMLRRAIFYLGEGIHVVYIYSYMGSRAFDLVGHFLDPPAHRHLGPGLPVIL